MNSDNLSQDEIDEYEEQLEQMDSKALLAGIHSELIQIRMLLQDGSKTDSEPTEAVYECKTCGQEIVKSELEAHAIEQHKAPANMPVETLGTRK